MDGWKERGGLEPTSMAGDGGMRGRLAATTIETDPKKEEEEEDGTSPVQLNKPTLSRALPPVTEGSATQGPLGGPQGSPQTVQQEELPASG